MVTAVQSSDRLHQHETVILTQRFMDLLLYKTTKPSGAGFTRNRTREIQIFTYLFSDFRAMFIINMHNISA